jgi:carboxyl-terminal processing protease
MLVGGLGGVYLEQQAPEWVPILGSSSHGQLNQAQLNQTLSILRAHYYDPTFDYSALTQSSLKGLVNGLGDPHSEYLSPAEYQSEQKGLAGTYTGIGVYLDFNGNLPLIVGTLAGSPARKAGIEAQDLIAKIDGKSAQGIKAQEATAEIEGPSGTPVSLTIQRGDQTLSIKVVRGQVELPEVASTKLPNGIFYIRIYTYADTTTAQFDDQLKAGLPGSKAVVLDLRENLGGLVASAAAVISQFVASGEIFETHERGGVVDKTSAAGSPLAPTIPMVVLVNADTASAAEITSGALRIRRHVELVGATTYGKGTVQEDFQVTGGADVHLTIAKWFFSDGTAIDGKGLVPDVPVALNSPTDMFDVTNVPAGYANDTQLNRALGILAGITS